MRQRLVDGPAHGRVEVDQVGEKLLGVARRRPIIALIAAGRRQVQALNERVVRHGGGVWKEAKVENATDGPQIGFFGGGRGAGAEQFWGSVARSLIGQLFGRRGLGFSAALAVAGRFAERRFVVTTVVAAVRVLNGLRCSKVGNLDGVVRSREQNVGGLQVVVRDAGRFVQVLYAEQELEGDSLDLFFRQSALLDNARKEVSSRLEFGYNVEPVVFFHDTCEREDAVV